MADDVSRDPDARGRCPPYPRQPLPSSVSETRFLASPHLTVFLLSHEHMREVLGRESLVTSPPNHSPLAPWLCSGDPEDFSGPLLMSWVFYRHMSRRDDHGNFTYSPRFYVRVASEGIAPFAMQMTSEWHEQANHTMALPACGRSVHHVPLRWVLPILLLRGQREVPLLPEWDCEIMSHEVVIHRHCLRASRHLLGTMCYDDHDKPSQSQPDFGAPSS
jgi:hypothetical protein